MTALLQELRALIAENGPVSLERYMALALGHPRYGYYMTRDPFGRDGDFTTAPEISQMFGELLGLWAAAVWDTMGRPDPVRLVELGPGRGTLMGDALRAARSSPAFRAAVDVHLVETSPTLRAVQKRTLAGAAVEPTWHTAFDTVPDGPALILANEFFDALPIRQFVRLPGGVHERLVGLDDEGRLTFGLSPDPVRRAAPAVPAASPIFEVSLVGEAIMAGIADRVSRQGGALLAIDYGHAVSGAADTLQAMKRHAFVDPLTEPGEADLTAHVDFAALARAARAAGAQVHGPVEQGAFLVGLGLRERAATLSRKASPDQAEAIAAAVARLAHPDPGMGQLFKVMAVSHPDTPPLPGFSSEVRP